MWPNPQFPADLVTFTEEILNRKLHFFVQCGKGWSLLRKPEARIWTTATNIDSLLYIRCQIWLDEIYVLIDNIYTLERHFQFYFPWWQNYEIVLKYFNMQFLATYSDAIRWTIYTVFKSELWKPLQLRYDCARFHLRGEEMLEGGGAKSCLSIKKQPKKNSFWMSLSYSN